MECVLDECHTKVEHNDKGTPGSTPVVILLMPSKSCEVVLGRVCADRTGAGIEMVLRGGGDVRVALARRCALP